MKPYTAAFTQPCVPGVTLTEYCILFALIGVLGIAGLKAMGNAANGLFENSSQKLESGGTLSLLNANSAGGTSGAGNGSNGSGNTLANGNNTGGRYQVVIDPATGQPSLKMINSTTGSGTNVSSSDGMQQTLGSLMAADTLQAMANAQADPATKNYYQELATWTYYLGGTEGVMDNVSGLTITESLQGNRNYAPSNALQDMQSYQGTIAALIANPPPGISPKAVEMVTPLANSSMEIAQSYLSANSQYIDKNGNIKQEVNSAATNGGNGNGNVNGNGLALGKDKPKKIKAAKESYDQLVPPGQIRATAQQLLHDNQVTSAPVETTLGNAAAVDPLVNPAPAP
jgi:Flp pilus assembly pilin Flp